MKYQGFTYKSEWIVSIGLDKLKNLYFPLSSQVYSMNRDDTRIVVKEHYNIAKEFSKQVTNTVGIWDINNGSYIFKETNIWERRKDLQGYEFVAETLSHSPYVNYEAADDGRVNEIVGIVGDLWHGILERDRNFSTKILLPPDGQWGNINKYEVLVDA